MAVYRSSFIVSSLSYIIVIFSYPDLIRRSAFMAAADHGSRNEISNKSGERNICDSIVETFVVFYTRDYGYHLSPENDLDTVIIPKFSNDAVRESFKTFFSNENLALHVGKKIHCECLGKRYEKDGAIFYDIKDARLFAK